MCEYHGLLFGLLLGLLLRGLLLLGDELLLLGEKCIVGIGMYSPRCICSLLFFHMLATVTNICVCDTPRLAALTRGIYSR